MNGNQLKWIAIVTMLIDHIGYVLVPSSTPLYGICRLIGRLAFPIFCFLLTEGLLHTRNRRRYLTRLLAFALVSEIPFDLAFHGGVLEFSSQNVFFTLFLGLLGLVIYDWLAPKISFAAMLGPLACVLAAEWMGTDYGGLGVLMISVCYLFRENRYLRLGALGAANVCMSLEFSDRQYFACAALIPLFFYNGERGKGGKWSQYFFYLFYPLHLLLLWGLSRVFSPA